MNENTEQPTPALKQILTPYPCPKCDRAFYSAPALRMHNVRAHGKGWDTSGNFHRGGSRGKTIQSEEKRLAIRRIYQKKLRARYYAEGKDSRGVPRPPGWQPPSGPARQPRGGNAGMKLGKWSPERRARFRRTMQAKSKRRQAQLFEQVYGPVGKTPSKRIKYVYPLPTMKEPDLTSHDPVHALDRHPNVRRPDKEVEDYIRSQLMNFCPKCGHDLHQWALKTPKE